MEVLILSLLGLFCVALLLGALRNRRLRRQVKDGRLTAMPGVQTNRPDGCCGQHAVCEKESLLAGVSREIEYYEDEELDAYAGRPSDRYSPEEEERFREVLYTMRQDEVAGWVRSLSLRGVALPDGLKDEVFLLVGERRGL